MEGCLWKKNKDSHLTEFLVLVAEQKVTNLNFISVPIVGKFYCLSIELLRQWSQVKPAYKKVIKYGLASGDPCRG